MSPPTDRESSAENPKGVSGSMKAGLALGLAAAIGAIGAWLWIGTRDKPAPGSMPVSQVILPGEGVSPKKSTAELGVAHVGEEVHRGLPHVLPKGAAPIAPVSSPARRAVGGERDDSTYFRVLASMQAFPQAASQLPPLMAWYESFVLTPDDPDWARPMERALREFIQKQSGLGRLEITSVSCRSEHCEVQLLAEMSESGLPADEGLMMPPKALVVRHPVGPSLREMSGIRMGLGDRTGIILMYKRERPEAEATSP